MSRRSGGPSAQQPPRMSYQGGYNGASQYQPHQGLGIRTTAGAQAAQQNYFQVRPMRMAPQSAQQRGGQIQFQQPPPTPGQSQQPQPQVSQVQQQNSQQHLGTARGFVAPQNMHQPTTMMFVSPYRMPGVQGVQIYPQPQHFPPGTFGTASPYQIGAYNQPPPNIPNQPNPRPQTPPTQGMPGAGGPAGHPAMNPMMPPYLSASQVQAASAAAASGHHSLPPNTHSQPPPPHMQHGGHVSGMPPSVSINQPQMATISAPKPYEKRKRTPLLIVNPETQEVVNLTESKASSSISETASEANSEVSEVKAEELALSETASVTMEVKEEDEVKEAAIEAAVVPEVNVEVAKVEVVSEPSEIHPESSSIDNDQVLEQTVENNDLEGKSKTKKKDAKVEKEAEKAAPEVEKEIELPTVTPQATVALSKPEQTEQQSEAEVVDGNCVSSKVEQNHVEQNHVGNNEDIKADIEKKIEKVEAEAEEVIKTNDDVEEVATNDINTEEGDEVVMENGTASSSANNSNPASKSSSLIKLKYNYNDEQWSPINTEGKKQYDRDFLVQLAKDPLSLRKPANLPSMDIIKERANAGNSRVPMVNASKDWTPGFVKPTPSKTGRDRPAGGPAGGRGGKPAPAVIDLKISDRDIKLQTTENAWKPSGMKNESNVPEDPLAELERNVRSILNKLTPQKFETLVEKFNGLPIDTEIKLKTCIELIFEKAVDEPEFSVAYARMCEVLREKDVGDKSVNFRKLLIARCQKEFERDYMEGFDRAKFEAQLAATESEGERKKLQAEFEEKERRARRRSLGNIRFIGELYNLKMLTDRIMHEIINKLIQLIDEESLECLCWLLNTIGKALEAATKAKLNAPPGEETNKNKQNLKPFDYYFDQMEDIAKKKKIPSRVRFMLQDVIDLRRNSWRPRREKAGPKTLDQIHKEAEREKTQAKLMEMAGPNVNSGGGGGGGGGGNQNNRGDRDNRGKRSSRGPQQSMEADEWNTVAYSGRSKGFDRSDAQKIQNLAMNANKTQDSSNMSLGPGYRSWGKGSGSAPKPPQQNRFSAIQNSDAEGQSRRNFSASMGNFNRSSNSRGSSVDPDRAGALEAVKQFSAVTSNGPNLAGGGPAQGPKDPKPERGAGGGPAAPSQANLPQVGGPSMSVDLGHMAHMPTPQTLDESKLMAEQTKVLKGPQDLTDDLLKRRTKGTLEEYLNLEDSDSAFTDVCSHFHPNHMSRVAEEMIFGVIEDKPSKMKKTGELLDSLVIKHALLPTQLQNAFNQLLQISTDLEVDIPKLWDNIAMVLAPPLASERSLSMKYLLEATQFLEPQQVPKFLSGVLHQLAEAKGRPKAGDMMKKSGLSLSHFMPSDQVPTFLISQKLEFIESPSNSAKDLIKYNVTKLLQENPQKYDAVFSWIEKNVTEEERTTKPKDFIRTLTVVLTEGSINDMRGQLTLNETEFTNRCSVLKRYVDANIDREKQVLYALQHLMHQMEHPNRLLFNIFNCLYNNDVISEEGFDAWLACSDPAEQEGKGVASKSTHHFFTWMRENDDNEGEDEE